MGILNGVGLYRDRHFFPDVTACAVDLALELVEIHLHTVQVGAPTRAEFSELGRLLKLSVSRAVEFRHACAIG